MDRPGQPASYPAGAIRPARSAPEAPLDFLRALAAEGADVVPFRLGTRPAFLLNHPAPIEDMLLRHAATFVKGRAFERARGLLGNGPLTASGASHLDRRRLVQGAFHHHRMPGYASVVLAHAARLRDGWTHGVPVDVGRSMRELTLGIAGEALFGSDLASCSMEVAAAIELAASERDGLISIVASRRETQDARRRLDTIIDTVLERRRASATPREDLLSLLLEALDPDNPDSMQQLRDDVVTFLLAAHDTIAHALTWTWLLLADHPAVGCRLAAEVDHVRGAGAPAADDFGKLPYARSVLAEALRLFPPAWVIVRQAARPHHFGDVLVPRGALVVASPFITHRDERFFSEPLRFQPERWLAGAGATHPQAPNRQGRCTYFPFGAGIRSCIGEGFAWMEGTLALAALAHRWQLTRFEGAGLTALPRITLRPAGPVLMTPLDRRYAEPR